MDKKDIKKVVLAYSGGLDTSIIIPWLKENYNNCEVIAVSGNVGQADELEGLEEKALKTGASKLYVEDLTDEFVDDFVIPTVQAGALYEEYMLGTSFARPVIAKRIVEIALKEGADAICHGCTGKGNDQVRFELTIKAFAPDMKIIAPWREWSIKSREEEIEYAEAHDVPLKINRETNEVTMVALKASGERATFKIFLDGKFIYDFRGYEGQACQKDIEPFMTALEEVYGIHVTERQEIWSNPDKISTMKYQAMNTNKNKR